MYFWLSYCRCFVFICIVAYSFFGGRLFSVPFYYHNTQTAHPHTNTTKNDTRSMSIYTPSLPLIRSLSRFSNLLYFLTRNKTQYKTFANSHQKHKHAACLP